MAGRFSGPARRAVVAATEHAASLGHRQVEPEHLLLGILANHEPLLASLPYAEAVRRVREMHTDSVRRAGLDEADVAALADLGIDVAVIVESAEEAFGPGALAADRRRERSGRRRRPDRRSSGRRSSGRRRLRREFRRGRAAGHLGGPPDGPGTAGRAGRDLPGAPTGHRGRVDGDLPGPPADHGTAGRTDRAQDRGEGPAETAWAVPVRGRGIGAGLRGRGGPLFSAQAKATLAGALVQARDLRDRVIGTEHLALALLAADTGVAGALLRAAGVDYLGARRAVMHRDRRAC
jgi:ClpA/ClpB-like protein